jgi:hypothetical protein
MNHTLINGAAELSVCRNVDGYQLVTNWLAVIKVRQLVRPGVELWHTVESVCHAVRLGSTLNRLVYNACVVCTSETVSFQI